MLMPLFDAYAEPARAKNLANPRFAPILSDISKLPNDMLLIIAGIDILAHEQLTFVERVKKDIEEKGEDGRRIEAKMYDKGFHGWLECEYILSTKWDEGAYNVQCLSNYSKTASKKYIVWLLLTGSIDGSSITNLYYCLSLLACYSLLVCAS